MVFHIAPTNHFYNVYLYFHTEAIWIIVFWQIFGQVTKNVPNISWQIHIFYMYYNLPSKAHSKYYKLALNSYCVKYLLLVFFVIVWKQSEKGLWFLAEFLPSHGTCVKHLADRVTSLQCNPPKRPSFHLPKLGNFTNASKVTAEACRL